MAVPAGRCAQRRCTALRLYWTFLVACCVFLAQCIDSTRVNPARRDRNFAPASSQAPPVVFYASSPTRPGESVIVQGHGLDQVATFEISSSVPSADHDGTLEAVGVQSPPLYANSSSTVFVIPSAMPPGAYTVQMKNHADQPVGKQFQVNYPEIWWVQGDGGDSASPGGWLRVFGKAVAYPAASVAANKAHKALETAIALAARLGDLEAARRLLSEAEASKMAMHNSLAPAQLRLTPVSDASSSTTVSPTIIVPKPVNATVWSAWFQLPENLLPGEYTVEVFNGYGWGKPMATFETPESPVKTTFAIAVPKPWPVTVFNVNDYNTSWSDTFWSYLPNSCNPFSRSGHIGQAVVWVGPGQSRLINATGQCRYGYSWSLPLNRTLEAARKAGGGIVRFPPGQFYLTDAVRVPDNVILAGSGASQTSLYFAFANSSDAAPRCHAGLLLRRRERTGSLGNAGFVVLRPRLSSQRDRGTQRDKRLFHAPRHRPCQSLRLPEQRHPSRTWSQGAVVQRHQCLKRHALDEWHRPNDPRNVGHQRRPGPHARPKLGNYRL
eukprot:m.86101 g.86101  ORF g.86101 m.86101 type:complete len:552 (+) comp14864_c0_seq3:146-1801(+)